MTREQLEHVIRAAAAITGDNEIIVIGSTSILGQFPNAPAEMLGSIEADEVHDLVLSKYAASREKDREFNRSAIRHGFVQREVLLGRLNTTRLDHSLLQILRQQIEVDFGVAGGPRG